MLNYLFVLILFPWRAPLSLSILRNFFHLLPDLFSNINNNEKQIQFRVPCACVRASLDWEGYFHSSRGKSCIGMATTCEQVSPYATDDDTYIRVQRKTQPAGWGTKAFLWWMCLDEVACQTCLSTSLQSESVEKTVNTTQTVDMRSRCYCHSVNINRLIMSSLLLSGVHMSSPRGTVLPLGKKYKQENRPLVTLCMPRGSEAKWQTVREWITYRKNSKGFDVRSFQGSGCQTASDVMFKGCAKFTFTALYLFCFPSSSENVC